MSRVHRLGKKSDCAIVFSFFAKYLEFRTAKCVTEGTWFLFLFSVHTAQYLHSFLDAACFLHTINCSKDVRKINLECFSGPSKTLVTSSEEKTRSLFCNAWRGPCLTRQLLQMSSDCGLWRQGHVLADQSSSVPTNISSFWKINSNKLLLIQCFR